MDRHSSPLAYACASFSAFVGSLTLNDFALYVGIITGLGTFLMNWYYKAKEDRRKEQRCDLT